MSLLKSTVERADKLIFNTVKGISYVSGICLVGIMLVAFFNVLGEKLRTFGLPVSGIPASTEIIQYLHIPVLFLAMAFVTLDRGQIKIDLLSSKFKLSLQQFFITLGDLCGFGVSSFISYRGFVQMFKFIALNKMSSVSGTGFPLWPFALIMALGFALLAFSFIWSIVRRYVITKSEQTEGGRI